MEAALRVRVGKLGDRPEDNITPRHRVEDLPYRMVLVRFQPNEPCPALLSKRGKCNLIDDIAFSDRE
jgi:hypothetical protein